MEDITFRFIEAYNRILSDGIVSGAKDFAHKIDISSSMMTEIVKRRSNIGLKGIQNIVLRFNINPEWLFTGKGNIQRSEPEILQDSLVMKNKRVPFYDAPVSAGPLGVLMFSKNTTDPDGYINLEIFNRCDAILPIVGISMEPEIHSGDLIGIRRLDNYNWEYVETGKIYMIITRDERMIKYINKADDSDFIICSSPNYHDFKVRKGEILEIYRVIASIKTF